jgi:uncharacterized protein (TIGR04222 family)
MNPFDLRGPEFLVFYAVLGILVTGAAAVLRRRSESATVATGPLLDYLRIAYLRAGADEALRVATLALIDRRLIEVVGDDRLKAVQATVPAGLPRTEQRLLESCKDATRASEILSDESLKVTVSSECEGQLVRAGLLPDEKVKSARTGLLFAGVFFLVLVAFLKILIALGRGRTNVGFLVVACLLFAFLVYRVTNPFRTLAGETMLADLRKLFSALQDRAVWMAIPSGGNDLALLAAVFGTGSLPVGVGYLERLFRKRDKSSTRSSCGSFGSSCGSGGGSSCGSGGSSCGGGCGGGCGGCGG